MSWIPSQNEQQDEYKRAMREAEQRGAEDGRKQGRAQAARECVAIVREWAEEHKEYEWGEDYRDCLDAERIRFEDRVERLVRAIEKGGGR